MADEEGPVIKPATNPPSDPAKSAVFIFLHGLGDDGYGWADIADQFQAAHKLPHLKWIFPSAPENRDAMERAWFTPTGLSPVANSRPELDDPEDEDGLMRSLRSIEAMIDDVVAKGTPAERVILGGFSQGCAMTLLVGLMSKWTEKLGGLAGLSGFIPLAGKIKQLREENNLPGKVEKQVPMFIARGTKDMLIPKRYWRICMETLKDIGIDDTTIESHEYEGMAHSASGAELRDLCTWLEKTVPSIE
ncbi:acyl-protein thioesterase 1 [Rhizodiscina lignyota]|uniref:Acyl-protein thioesterase 1 n=1 Tax=Rhizodiscina lignyota TaxID=1504668 RepID=A0A9P4IDT5_9PEZI|nr:acyl-protein thioesterase 1 [Rhizodiscina lignyota]